MKQTNHQNHAEANKSSSLACLQIRSQRFGEGMNWKTMWTTQM